MTDSDTLVDLYDKLPRSQAEQIAYIVSLIYVVCGYISAECLVRVEKIIKENLQRLVSGEISFEVFRSEMTPQRLLNADELIMINALKNSKLFGKESHVDKSMN